MGGGIFKGILLPHVAVERGWNVREFLSRACIKARLKPDSWMNKNVRVYAFMAETFAEEEPEGRVYRVDVQTPNS